MGQRVAGGGLAEASKVLQQQFLPGWGLPQDGWGLPQDGWGLPQDGWGLPQDGWGLPQGLALQLSRVSAVVVVPGAASRGASCPPCLAVLPALLAGDVLLSAPVGAAGAAGGPVRCAAVQRAQPALPQ